MIKILTLIRGIQVLKYIPFLKKFSFAFVLIAALLGSGYFWHTVKVEQALVLQKTELQAKYDIKHIELMKKTQKATEELNKSFAEVERKKNEEILSITRTHNRTVAGLRDRLTRAQQAAIAAHSEHSSDGEGKSMCTGAELPREDASFLAWEATRAERLRIELIACYAKNEKVESILNNLREKSDE